MHEAAFFFFPFTARNKYIKFFKFSFKNLLCKASRCFRSFCKNHNSANHAVKPVDMAKIYIAGFIVFFLQIFFKPRRNIFTASFVFL